MKIEVPVVDDQGNLKYTATLTEKEVQAVLQFGLNMAIAMGIASSIMKTPESTNESTSLQ